MGKQVNKVNRKNNTGCLPVFMLFTLFMLFIMFTYLYTLRLFINHPADDLSLSHPLGGLGYGGNAWSNRCSGIIE